MRADRQTDRQAGIQSIDTLIAILRLAVIMQRRNSVSSDSAHGIAEPRDACHVAAVTVRCVFYCFSSLMRRRAGARETAGVFVSITASRRTMDDEIVFADVWATFLVKREFCSGAVVIQGGSWTSLSLIHISEPTRPY